MDVVRRLSEGSLASQSGQSVTTSPDALQASVAAVCTGCTGPVYVMMGRRRETRARS